MKTATRFHRRPTEHTEWCARDHRCGVDLHRSPDLIADAIGGRAVITRVRAGHTEYTEIIARIPLHSNGKAARWQVATTLHLMRGLLAAVAVRVPALGDRDQRRALGQRAA